MLNVINYSHHRNPEMHRILFKFGVDMHDLILKIYPIYPKNIKEIAIYNELKQMKNMKGLCMVLLVVWRKRNGAWSRKIQKRKKFSRKRIERKMKTNER